ncbi:MAG: hypothetical protein EBS87_07985 [Sphingomonadaceae bacterium]|nr:hypothetical protein [Sphingomonadaceae bacterium]NCA02112.1 hypothetical protein [Sphingomonadaceae bacterium]
METCPWPQSRNGRTASGRSCAARPTATTRTTIRADSRTRSGRCFPPRDGTAWWTMALTH